MILLLSIFLASAEAAPRLVRVQGECELKVSPDRGRLELRMDHTAPSAQKALEVVNSKIEEARKEIKALKLADLELSTTTLSNTPHREWENNKSVLKGQRASLGLEVVTSEIARLGEVFAVASKLGLNNTQGFQSYLSVDKRQKEYLRCLDIAAQDALKKAQKLAASLNAKVGAVESIDEAPQNRSFPAVAMYAMEADAVMAKGAAAPTVDVAEQSFRTTLQVSFQLQ